jgi:glutamate-1-semialdehyde 2,1-aminomutase
VVEAVTRQMARGTHYGASHALEIEWAKWVTELMPSVEKVRFHSSGTEATMMAIRLARGFTGRSRLIKFENHFHGWHDLVSGANVPDETTPFAFGVARELMQTLHVLPAGDIDAVARTIRDDGEIAAVIVEPTGAHYGEEPLLPSFLHELRQVTAETGVVLIFDEVVTGFRISDGGVQKRYGVMPDLTTMAKIVAGGLPGGAVGGNASIMSVLDLRNEERATDGRIYHPGTFNANPLSASAAVAALPLVKAGAPAAAEALAAPLVRGINRALDDANLPGAAWCHASIMHFTLGQPCHRPDGIEWDTPEQPPLPDPDLLANLAPALINRGVHFMGAANAAFVSSVHTPEEIDSAVEAFAGALGDLKAAGLL